MGIISRLCLPGHGLERLLSELVLGMRRSGLRPDECRVLRRHLRAAGIPTARLPARVPAGTVLVLLTRSLSAVRAIRTVALGVDSRAATTRSGFTLRSRTARVARRLAVLSV